MPRPVLPLCLALILVTGCTGAGPDARSSPAVPAVAPVPTTSPAGRTIPVGPEPAAVAVRADGRQIAVGLREAVVVLDANGDPGPTRHAAGAPARAVRAAPGGFRALVGNRVLTHAGAAPTVWHLPADGGDLAELPDGGVAVTLPTR